MSAAPLLALLALAPAARAATVETALAQGLRPLKGPGFAVLSEPALVAPLLALPEREALIREVRAIPDPILSRDPGTTVLVWERSVGAVPGVERTIPSFGALTGLLARLDESLARALPDEPLAMTQAELRRQEGRAGGDYLHVDGQYLTLTYALEGPGTTLYPARAGAPPSLPTRAGEAVLITNLEREAATGVPATVHSSPLEGVPPRVMLIARWSRRGAARAGEPELALREGVADRIRAVKRRLDALGLPSGGAATEEKLRELLGLAPARLPR